jgi:hypothetical protein
MYGSYTGYGAYANAASGFATNVGSTTHGSNDTAYFFDSQGNATFYAYADNNSVNGASGEPAAGMYGSYSGYGAYANSASGFAINIGISTHGSGDTAYFYDSQGGATYYAYADFTGSGFSGPSAGMYGSYAGYGKYANWTSGFATNIGNSTHGSNDTAYFYDAQGNATYYAYADYTGSGSSGPSAGMYGSYSSFGAYANSANGFATNVGDSTAGSSDTAYFYDTTDTGTFYAYANAGNKSTNGPTAGMYGSYDGAYANSANGFATNIGVATNSGNDTAYLFGPPSGNNTLYTDLAIAQLYGSNYDEQASGFGVVDANGAAGGVNTDTQGPGSRSYQLNLIGIWGG